MLNESCHKPVIILNGIAFRSICGLEGITNGIGYSIIYIRKNG